MISTSPLRISSTIAKPCDSLLHGSNIQSINRPACTSLASRIQLCSQKIFMDPLVTWPDSSALVKLSMHFLQIVFGVAIISFLLMMSIDVCYSYPPLGYVVSRVFSRSWHPL